MPELRKDPLTGRWVIISKERSVRPASIRMEKIHIEHSYCPYCKGHEDRTPDELYSVRQNGNGEGPGDWIVRVIPNKFPALTSDQQLQRYGIGIYDAMSGTGAHEVIIEHPDHVKNMADFEQSQVEEVFKVYRSRLLALYQDHRFRYIMVFKNYGQYAGAGMSHSHSQIVALPVVPRNVKVELEASKAHFKHKERCIFCDVIKQELVAGERIISENEAFIAYTPFASRFPFEITIIPKTHNHRYANITDQGVSYLASMVKDVLTRLKVTLNDPAYNIVLHTAPNTVKRPANRDYWSSIEYDYHWHLEIVPRLTNVAGFEWGTGFYINPTPPEEAADFLRDYERYMLIDKLQLQTSGKV